MKRWLGIALLLVTLGALALRLPELDARPMHNDEAVNAIKLQRLWETGAFHYDPDEYHGPVLHYAALPSIWLSGAEDFPHVTEATLRVVPVFFGVAMILMLRLLADGLGRAATVAAGVLTAISPAMVFYSRYFIHETLLVCFTLLLLGAGWRYTRTRHIGWALLAGAAAGLMYATKETFVLPLAAMAGGVLLTMGWETWQGQRATDSESSPTQTASSAQAKQDHNSTPGWCRVLCLRLIALASWKHVVAAGVMAAAVAIIFFTSFFTNLHGPLDALRTYLPWMHRAGGASPHIHPWHFYLERLLWFHQGRGPVWSEALILILAAVGIAAARRGRGLADAEVTCVRFLAFYTLLLAVAYSLISYKTPWCLLGFLQGLILLAGAGVVVVLRWRTWRWVQAALSATLVIAAAHLVWLAWQTSFVFPADRRNPYVYAQTSPDLLELVEKIQAISRVDSQGDNLLIKVMVPGGDFWPLPWYLRQFKQVGWWDTPPPDPLAPVMIAGMQYESDLEKKAGASHLMTGIFSLRPSVRPPLNFLELYVESGLWKKYVERKLPSK